MLDASALLFLLERKPAGNKVNELLKEALRGRAEIVMSTINGGEVYGKLLRELGQERAAAAMKSLNPLPVALVDATLQRAFHAAEIKLKHHLYYGDSFAAALAIERKGTLVTGDSDFRRLGHSVPVVWLKP